MEVLHPRGIVVRRTRLSLYLMEMWERRYKAVRPARTGSRRRTYTQGDIERLKLLKKAVDRGEAIGHVAPLSSDDLTSLLEHDIWSCQPGRVIRNGVEEPARTADFVLRAEKAIEGFDIAALESTLLDAEVGLSRPALLEQFPKPLFQQIGKKLQEGMIRKAVTRSIVLVIGLFLPETIQASWQIDVESGLAISGYNDVRIPGNTGTKFSLSRDLKIDATAFWRARTFHTFRDKHTLAVVFAPLRLEAGGRFGKDIRFAGGEFAVNTPVVAKNRFDSYRLTYRYDFYRGDRLRLGVGFTGKVRDAAISVEGGGEESEKTNKGFVPLINSRAPWTVSPRFRLLPDGDALATPQGRAEDVILALTANASKNLQFKTGYRFLEEGADSDEVYTFAMVDCVVLGAVWSF